MPHLQQVPGDMASIMDVTRTEEVYSTSIRSMHNCMLEEPVSLSLSLPEKLMSQERWHQKVIHPVPSWRVFPMFSWSRITINIFIEF